MQVTSVTQNSATAASSVANAASTAASSQYTDFLTLLTTELQNQDPTKPMDPTQTVTQLATFSSVQQSVQSNQYLSALLDASQLTQASNFVGRTVTTADNAITGVIKSVSLTSSGLVATLTNGKSVTLGAGITIS